MSKSFFGETIPAADLKKELLKWSKARWELEMQAQCRRVGLVFKTQYYFCPDRNYTADLAFEREKLIVEVDGGAMMKHGGAHSGKNKEKDCIRDAKAILLGWRVLRVTPGMVESGLALQYVENLLAMKSK